MVVTEATFTGKMLNILKAMKGKTLLSYERETDSYDFEESDGNLRINFAEGSVELWNLEQVLPINGEGATEEITVFEAKAVDPKEPYKHCYNRKHKECELPAEKIVAVEIITDEVLTENGRFKITFDQAVVIRTENHTYMFSKGVWFSDTIRINFHGDYDRVYPVSEVVDSFSDTDDNTYTATVKRTRIEL